MLKAITSLAVILFVVSLAAFGSAVGIVGAFVSAGWITYILRRFDRAEVIDAEEVDRDV